MIYVVFLRYLDHNFDLQLNFKQLGNKITSTQGQEWIESQKHQLIYIFVFLIRF